MPRLRVNVMMLLVSVLLSFNTLAGSLLDTDNWPPAEHMGDMTTHDDCARMAEASPGMLASTALLLCDADLDCQFGGAALISASILVSPITATTPPLMHLSGFDPAAAFPRWRPPRG